MTSSGSKRQSKHSRNYKHRKPITPVFCDFTCRHAAFAPVDAVGACRKELAVYCMLIDEYNTKHARCRARDQNAQT